MNWEQKYPEPYCNHTVYRSEMVVSSCKDIEQKERDGDYTSQCDTANLGVVIDGEV